MASSSAPAPARSLYFVNPVVDFAMIGGLSIALYLAMRCFGDGQRSEVIWTTSAALAWVINWPHFSATSYRLYHSRENVRQYPLTAFAIPAVLLCLMVGAFVLPGELAPPLIKLFLIWSPYHFSGQTLGISLVYARRAGFPVGKLERLGLSGFIFGTYATQTARAEVTGAASSYYSVSTTPLGLPQWVPDTLQAGMIGCGLLFVVAIAYRAGREGRWPAPIILLPAVTQFTWFVLGPNVASFNEFVPMFHSLQYLLIAWAMQLKEKMDLSGAAPSRGFAWNESLRWSALNLMGGIGLFWLLPRVFSWTGVEFGLATAVALAGVQLHHFVVDGVIWKLKNPKVSSPLLVNLGEMVRSEPARQPQVVSA